jgi:hypothetical protein
MRRLVINPENEWLATAIVVVLFATVFISLVRAALDRELHEEVFTSILVTCFVALYSISE